MKKMLGFCLLSACSLGALFTAAETSFSSGPTQVALLELYSSEGCSSCPPADRWLSGLLEHEQLFSQVIPVAFQVDYWDYIGWQDPYAKPEYSARQRKYARAGFTSGVYTPGLFLNGREWRGWRRGRNPIGEAATVGVLNLDNIDFAWRMTFTSDRYKSRRLHANIALLGFDLASRVSKGENAGRKLQHDFVVLDWRSQALTDEGVRFEAFSYANTDNKRLAVVAWVTKSDQTPVQATGGWLKP